MDLFDEEEENKLEYTNVYQDYVHLMEHLLDATLKNDTYNHTDEEVDEFYTSFKEESKVYITANEDVMDLLFGLVDFQKFKRSVLEYKKGCIDDKATEDSSKLEYGKQGYDYDEFMKEYHSNPDDKASGWVRKIT